MIVFVGFNLTFFPQFVLGYLGMPRRYHAYPEEFQVLNVMSTAGASILGVGYLIPLVYLAWSMRYGQKARRQPVGRAGPRVADRLAAAHRTTSTRRRSCRPRRTTTRPSEVIVG